MSELTDDQLDKLFRKSAEEFVPVFDPAAWQEMNVCLDAHDQTKPNGVATWKNLLRWGLPILLLLVVGGWYAYRPEKVVVTPALSPTAAGSGAEAARIENRAQSLVKPRFRKEAEPEANAEPKRFLLPRSAESNIGVTRQDAKDETKTTTPKNLAGRVEMLTKPAKGAEVPEVITLVPEKSVTPKPVVEVKRESVRSGSVALTTRKAAHFITHSAAAIHPKNRTVVQKRGTVTTHRNSMAFSADAYARKSTPSLPNQSVEVESGIGVPDTQTNGTESAATVQNWDRVVSMPALTEQSIQPTVWFRPVLLIERPVVWQADKQDVRRVVSQTDPLQGLSVRFVVAPDLSAVGLKNFSRPGTNLGLLLEYRLASRWSIQAGVMKSTKVYRAMSADYTMPDDMKKWSVYPYGVNGRCSIVDIPINLRYDVVLRPWFNNQPPNRWFVSAGVTSYIMNQEEYTYMYADPVNPHIHPNNRQGSGSTGKYGFSQLNLSSGYERSISRRLSWQVEPFIKVPLRKVGYFKIDLLSTGAFFSLRYKL